MRVIRGNTIYIRGGSWEEASSSLQISRLYLVQFTGIQVIKLPPMSTSLGTHRDGHLFDNSISWRCGEKLSWPPKNEVYPCFDLSYRSPSNLFKDHTYCRNGIHDAWAIPMASSFLPRTDTVPSVSHLICHKRSPVTCKSFGHRFPILSLIY